MKTAWQIWFKSYLNHLIFLILDQRTCSWVSGVHGPAGVWEETWPDNYAQTTRYSGSSQKTHQGTCRLFTNIVLDIFWSRTSFRRTKLWLSFLRLCAWTIFDWKVSLSVCLLCAAKKKTTDIYLQHLQSCQTRRRGRRGYRCILGAACGGTTSWRRKWGFRVKLFNDFRLFLKALNFLSSSSDCCVKVWSHQAEEEVFFFFQVFSDWVG